MDQIAEILTLIDENKQSLKDNDYMKLLSLLNSTRSHILDSAIIEKIRLLACDDRTCFRHNNLSQSDVSMHIAALIEDVKDARNEVDRLSRIIIEVIAERYDVS
jgi:hypothetical protein